MCDQRFVGYAWQPWKVDDLPTKPTSPAAIASTITLDVNPSMELSVDAQHRILQTKAYNKDAKQILASIDLKNKELDEALTLLFANATYQKYLANGILKSVSMPMMQLCKKSRGRN